MHTPTNNIPRVWSLRAALAGLTLAAVAFASQAVAAGPGTLDSSFGADGGKDSTPDGVVGLSLGSGNELAQAVAVQKDGKIILVGSSTSTGKTSNIVIARLNRNGTVDKSFGADGDKDGTPDGVVSLDLGDSSDEARAVAIQADGKIVIAGNSKAKSGNLIVARLNTNGSLDKSFGADSGKDGTPDGVVSVSLGDGDDVVDDMAIDKKGRIVLVGSTMSTGKSSNIVVARLLSNGNVDKRFGADGDKDGTPDGVVSLDLGESSDEARAVAIQADGKIVVAGNSKAKSSNLIVARLNTNGSLDTRFGADSGKDGTPDGVVSVSLGEGDDVVNDLAIDANGQIVLVGSTSSTGKSSNIVVARLSRHGSMDKRFGADGDKDGTPDGVVSLDLGESSDEARAIVIQADGKIVIAGNSKAQSSNLIVARLNTNGSFDKSFGVDGGKDGTPDGVSQISLGDGDDVAKGLVLQANGRILVVGDRVNGASSDAFVARLLAQ